MRAATTRTGGPGPSPRTEPQPKRVPSPAVKPRSGNALAPWRPPFEVYRAEMGDLAVGLLVDAPARTDPGSDTGIGVSAHERPPSHRRRPAPPDAPRQRWQFWRSPPDQPNWARPA